MATFSNNTGECDQSIISSFLPAIITIGKITLTGANQGWYTYAPKSRFLLMSFKFINACSSACHVRIRLTGQCAGTYEPGERWDFLVWVTSVHTRLYRIGEARKGQAAIQDCLQLDNDIISQKKREGPGRSHITLHRLVNKSGIIEWFGKVGIKSRYSYHV